MNIYDVACVVHEAQRGLQIVQGDPCPSAPWLVASQETKDLCAAGVMRAIEPGMTPAALHNMWIADKVLLGWRYGPVKDGVNRTHPCLVPFDQLPGVLQAKDRLFIAVVRALANA